MLRWRHWCAFFTLAPCQAPQRAEENVEPEEEEVEPEQEEEECSEPRIAEHEQKLDLIEEAGIRLNAQLEALVRDFTLEALKNAIAYYRQTSPHQGSERAEDRPTRRLAHRLESDSRWWKAAEPEKSREEEEFEKWYAEAIASGKSRRRSHLLAQQRLVRSTTGTSAFSRLYSAHHTH